ncbi:hypothetical protein FB446DRAFT_731729 [Lentinula raphanica]|nr:hypothetical protein FB446DRAFT_731729 [Lentinula raphanica]
MRYLLCVTTTLSTYALIVLYLVSNASNSIAMPMRYAMRPEESKTSLQSTTPISQNLITKYHKITAEVKYEQHGPGLSDKFVQTTKKDVQRLLNVITSDVVEIHNEGPIPRFSRLFSVTFTNWPMMGTKSSFSAGLESNNEMGVSGWLKTMENVYCSVTNNMPTFYSVDKAEFLIDGVAK